LRVRSRRALGGALLTVTAFASGSCANDERAEGSRRVWIGAVQDSDLMIGVVQSGKAASVFVCGGPSSFATQTHWFSSPIGLDSPFSLSAGDFRLEGSTSADSIEGVLRDDTSDARSFSARQVDNASLAGLYDARGPCGHLGLIIQPSLQGEPAAAQGACLKTENGAQIVEQVNPVMPLAQDANAGVAVTVGADLDRVFILHPLVPAGS